MFCASLKSAVFPAVSHLALPHSIFCQLCSASLRAFRSLLQFLSARGVALKPVHLIVLLFLALCIKLLSFWRNLHCAVSVFASPFSMKKHKESSKKHFSVCLIICFCQSPQSPKHALTGMPCSSVPDRFSRLSLKSYTLAQQVCRAFPF